MRFLHSSVNTLPRSAADILAFDSSEWRWADILATCSGDFLFPNNAADSLALVSIDRFMPSTDPAFGARLYSGFNLSIASCSYIIKLYLEQYKIGLNKNGHRYIGSAVNLSSRWRTHRWAMIGKK